MPPELSKEQQQLMRKLLSVSLPSEKWKLNCRHVFLTFMAFCALGSPSSMSSRRIPPSPRWSCLSKSLSRAFLSFKLYLGLKAYFPSTTSIFGLLTRACNRDRHFKPWNTADTYCFFPGVLLSTWTTRYSCQAGAWSLNRFQILGSYNPPRHRAPPKIEGTQLLCCRVFVYLFSCGKSSVIILYMLLERSSSIPFWYPGALGKMPGATFWINSAKSSFPHNQRFLLPRILVLPARSVTVWLVEERITYLII